MNFTYTLNSGNKVGIDYKESHLVNKGYIGYSPVQKLYALSEQLDILLFYTALLLIFFFFFYELLQNYIFFLSFSNLNTVSL